MAEGRIDEAVFQTSHLYIRLNYLAKRLVDLGVAVVLLALCLLPMVAVAAVLFLMGRPVLRRDVRLGLDRGPFTLYSFALWTRLVRHLPMLVNVLKGDLSLVGPRAFRPADLTKLHSLDYVRFDVKPGLVGLYWLRRQANIAYDGEAATDVEYAQRQSFAFDLGLMLRACVALIPWLAGKTGLDSVPVTVNITGIRFDNLAMSEVLDRFLEYADQRTPRQACFVYADCANIAACDPEYMRVLREADLVLADGLGLNLAGRMLGTPIRENLCGTDVFPRFCEKFAGTGKSVYLLGAKPGVVDALRVWIRRNHPGLIVAGSHHGYFTPEQEPGVVRDIAASRADVLLVAMGVPRQDQWIAQHLHQTGVKLAMGVGALFDVYSGQMRRAPQWVREMGMEWLYRLCQEPRRLWKRYIVGNVTFLRHVRAQMRQARRTEKAFSDQAQPRSGRAAHRPEIPRVARHISGGRGD